MPANDAPYPELDALGSRRLELALAEARGPSVVRVDSSSFERYVPADALQKLADCHALPYLRPARAHPIYGGLSRPMGTVGIPTGVPEDGQARRRITGFGYPWDPASIRYSGFSAAFAEPGRTVQIAIEEAEAVTAILEVALFDSKTGVTLRVEGASLTFEGEHELTVDQWREVRNDFDRYAATINRAVDASNVRLATVLLAWADDYERDAHTRRTAVSDRWDARLRELGKARPALARIVAGPLREWYWQETERIALTVEPEVTARRGASPLETLLFQIRMLATETLEDDLAADKTLWTFVEEEIQPGKGYSYDETRRNGLRVLLEKRLAGWIKLRVGDLKKVLARHGYASDAVRPYTLHSGERPNPSAGLSRLSSGRTPAPEAFVYWPDPSALKQATDRVCEALVDLLNVSAEEAQHQRGVRRAKAEATAAALWKDVRSAHAEEADDSGPAVP